VSNDGDRKDPDSPTESSPEPDEFDSLVLDEHFISRGIREAWIPDHQRAVRPPGALPRVPPPIRHHESTPQTRTPSWTPRGASREMRSTGLLLGTAAVVVLLVVMTGFMHIGPGIGGPSGSATVLPSATQFAGTTQSARPTAVGLSAMTPLGTCFNLRAPSKFVVVQRCSDRHQYELINRVLASGTNDQYPADSYWSGVADQQCAVDLQNYLGSPAANAPAGVTAGSFDPTPAGWAAGDRTVYCVAISSPQTAGTLYNYRVGGHPGSG